MTPTQLNRIRQWIIALRSGDYEQGKGYLKQVEGGYCCLGVLCDLHRLEHGQYIDPVTYLPTNWNKDTICSVGFEYEGNDLSLPNSVWDWIGLDCSDPQILMSNEERPRILCLSHLNDSGIPFDQIATFIEEAYLT